MSIIIETTKKVKNLFSRERLDLLAKETGLIKRKKKIVAKDFLFHHLCLSLSKDSSIADLAEQFPGLRNQKAGIKLQTIMDVVTNSLTIYSDSKKVKFDFGQFLEKTKKSIVEKNILLGASKLPCRIVAIRLPPEAYQQRLKNLAEKNRKNGHKQKSNPSIWDEWTVFVTNLSSSAIPKSSLPCISH